MYNNIFSKVVIGFVITQLIFILTSCVKEYPLIETGPTLTKKSIGLVSKEVVEKPSIKLEDIFDETTIATLVEESTEKKVEENDNKLVVIDEDITYHGDNVVDYSKDNWTYGMTPCEWVYIKPGIQLISNTKPGSSKTFPATGKNRVSSGKKGCYVPIFCQSDSLAPEYEGRVYVMDDYTKIKPEDMPFSNSLYTLKYQGKPIEEILMSAYPLTRLQNGVLASEAGYVNIVYVNDLDKILTGVIKPIEGK